MHSFFFGFFSSFILFIYLHEMKKKRNAINEYQRNKTVRIGFFFLNFKYTTICVTEEKNKYIDYILFIESYDKTEPVVINVHPCD